MTLSYVKFLNDLFVLYTCTMFFYNKRHLLKENMHLIKHTVFLISHSSSVAKLSIKTQNKITGRSVRNLKKLPNLINMKHWNKYQSYKFYMKSGIWIQIIELTYMQLLVSTNAPCNLPCFTVSQLFKYTTCLLQKKIHLHTWIISGIHNELVVWPCPMWNWWTTYFFYCAIRLHRYM